MSVLPFSEAWDEAARRLLAAGPQSEIAPEQLRRAAGLRVRSGLAGGASYPTSICGETMEGTYHNCQTYDVLCL